MNENCTFTPDSSRSFLSALLRAAQFAEGRIEGALGEAGLSLAKLGVLNQLVQSGEALPLGRIAGRISCVKSNVTQLVDRLEAEGLVSRVSDASDRRCIRAAITDRGRERYSVGEKILRRQEELLIEGIGSEKVEDMINSLSLLGAASQVV